ncbi:MAG: class I SAM-dependent methyltransferase [Halobacteriales archaeon]
MGSGRRQDVQATYDRIASHFAQTREYPWPETEEFLAGRQVVTALDIGCGNGRNAEVLAAHAERVIGLDMSRGLLDEARARANERKFPIELIHGDAGRLPIAADSVELALYIATLHHLPTRADRRRSLDELGRVLMAEGTALISAWSVSHRKFDADTGFDTTVEWTLPDGETVDRFYHIYDLDEFEADLAASRLSVIESYESEGNCYAVVGASP